MRNWYFCKILYKKNLWMAQRMEEIIIEDYSEEYVKKAIVFYKAFQDGTIAEAIKKGMRK